MRHNFVLHIVVSSSDTLACVAAVGRQTGKREGVGERGKGLPFLFPAQLFYPSPAPFFFFFSSAMQANLFCEGRVINSASLPLEPEPVKLSLRRRNIYVYPPDEYLDKDLSPYPPEEQLQLEWV